MSIFNTTTSKKFGKSFLIALFLSGFTAIGSTHAQTLSMTSKHPVSTCTELTASIPTVGLNVLAYPLENSAKIKVQVNNATGRQILLLFKDEIGRIIYSKHYPQSNFFEGIFNLSLLESGKYTLQVSTLTKVGFIKHSYKQAFYINSQLNRSISPFAPTLEKGLITLQTE